MKTHKLYEIDEVIWGQGEGGKSFERRGQLRTKLLEHEVMRGHGRGGGGGFF